MDGSAENVDGWYLHLLKPAEGDAMINGRSGIGELLETCYLSRKVALATFKEILVSFQRPGYRTPWPHMLRAIQHAQNMQHCSNFPQFSLLPPHLQSRVWKFAFLLNTTYNTSSCRNALATCGHTEGYDDEIGKGFCNIYGTDGPSGERFVMYNWKARTAESITAFWAYTHCPRGFGEESAGICLAFPSLSDESAKPPPFLVLSDGTKVWEKEERDRGEYVTKTSCIPQLLQTCRASRQVSLETWREVLMAYRRDEYRVPWGNMLAAIAWNLHLLHQTNWTRMSEGEGREIMDDKTVSLKRKGGVFEGRILERREQVRQGR